MLKNVIYLNKLISAKEAIEILNEFVENNEMLISFYYNRMMVNILLPVNVNLFEFEDINASARGVKFIREVAWRISRIYKFIDYIEG